MSELVQLKRMQRVHRILTDGQAFGAATFTMVKAMHELSSPEPDQLDYRLLEVHAAAAILSLSSCTDFEGSPSIQAYRRLTLARRELARLPARSRARRSFEFVVAQNRVQGNQYFDLAKGVDIWREGFRRDYTNPASISKVVDAKEVIPPKLNLGKYVELVERTNGPQLPLAVQVATNLERAYMGNEPASNAFGHAGQLFRYVVDQPYPEVASHASD